MDIKEDTAYQTFFHVECGYQAKRSDQFSEAHYMALTNDMAELVIQEMDLIIMGGLRNIDYRP